MYIIAANDRIVTNIENSFLEKYSDESTLITLFFKVNCHKLNLGKV